MWVAIVVYTMVYLELLDPTYRQTTKYSISSFRSQYQTYVPVINMRISRIPYIIESINNCINLSHPGIGNWIA